MYLAAETVASARNLLHSQFLSQMGDNTVDYGVDSITAMSRNPSWDVDFAGLEVTRIHLVAVEKVWKDREITVGSEVIRKQLSVDEDAEHVAQDYDRFIGRFFVLWIREICSHYTARYVLTSMSNAAAKESFNYHYRWTLFHQKQCLHA